MTQSRKSIVNTRKLTLAAMFVALAYVSVVLFRLKIMPTADFLTYDVKDVVITLGGLILGPLYALLIAVITAFLEMISISDTGPIGFIMNALSSSVFACTAAIIYTRRKTLNNALIGLICGVIIMVITMLLWNYIITPMYQGVPREVVAGMLPTVFLPFNALKGGLNAAFTFLLYRPVIGMLRAAKLMPASSSGAKKKLPVVPLIVAVALIVTCVLVILSMNDVI